MINFANPNVRDVVLFDCDGTLITPMPSRQYPFEDERYLSWDRPSRNAAWEEWVLNSSDDPPNEAVCTLCRLLADVRHVIILTNRRDTTRRVTEGWLARHDVPYQSLIMRNQPCFRCDDEYTSTHFKLMAINVLRSVGHHISMAFEDQPDIARAFRREGITTFLVGEMNER